MSDHPNLLQVLLDQNVVLSAMQNTLGNLSGTVNEMKRDLLGNGQPGRVSKLESRMSEAEKHRNQMIGWIAGASAVAATLTGGVVTLLVWLHIIPMPVKP